MALHFIPDASFTPDHKLLAASGAAPNHFQEVFVTTTKDFAPRQLTNMSEQWKDFKLTSREVIELEIQRRYAYPRRPGEAHGLRSSAEISIAGGNSRWSHGFRHPGGCRRPLLSHRTLCRQGRADFET